MAKKEGVWNKLVDYLGFGPEDEEYEDDELEAEEEQVHTQQKVWPADSTVKRQVERHTPVVAMPTASVKQTGFKVLVVEPRSFEEVQTIVDQMRNRRPVILNLEQLDKELAQKILNFLNGAIYALGGETQRVSHGIFFYAPQGVDVSNMGRGLTGTAIAGGAVDLPPGILEKLTGIAAEKESIAARLNAAAATEESFRTIGRPTGMNDGRLLNWNSLDRVPGDGRTGEGLDRYNRK